MVRSTILDAVHKALHGLGIDNVPSGVTVERPANPDHGDWSTNASLVCAKMAKKNPRQLGEELLAELEKADIPHVDRLDIAGPGFINFVLAPTWLHEVLREVVAQGTDRYARLDIGGGLEINLEFVSSNPTGPLHAGGGRWGAFGDSLARILERCGYRPHREFYINDRGTQTTLFGQSLSARKGGHDVPDGGYQGDYVTEWAKEMPDTADPAAWGIERALKEVEDSLAAMHVRFDTWSSERALVASGAVEVALEALRRSGHVYEKDDATWLATSELGDDKDRVLIKADGEYTYLLPDIAYHHDKYNRGDIIIDILGADHHGYVPRIRAALVFLGHEPNEYEAIIGQNVKLVRGGQEVKLSKRFGTMIAVDELIDELGPDVTRFAYLTQSIDTSQTIDIDVWKAQASENPVYYVQYAHARIHAIGREAEKRGIERAPLESVDLSGLVDPNELAVLRHLLELEEVLLSAARDRAPHRVTTWVRELAAHFHSFYSHCPILRSDVDPDLQQARLWLVDASRVGLAIGLDLLGVEAPEQM
ncbi:MAG: arginine--tRNA ligase [Acidimicrobiales bacterium]